MQSKPLFFDESRTDTPYRVNTDLRFNIAEKIVLHCALVAGKESGEDSAGRQAIQLMAAKDVAARALDIAGELVDQAMARDWIKDATLTDEDKTLYASRLLCISDTARYTKRKEVKELVAAALGTAVED